MNKINLYNILLIGCPTVAIAFGAYGKSVEIRDRVTNVSTYQSYFALLPESCFSLSMILAVAIAAVALVFAVMYVVTGNENCLKSIYMTSFASIIAGEVPTMMQSELLVLPAYMLLPLLMVATCAMAYHKMKKTQKGQTKKEPANRLQPRR